MSPGSSASCLPRVKIVILWPRADGVSHEVWSDEAGAAEDEEVERRGGSRRRKRGGAREGGKPAGEQSAAGGGGRLEEVATACHGDPNWRVGRSVLV